MKLRNIFKDEKALSDAVDIIKGLVMIVVVGAIGVFVADQVVTTTNLNPNMVNDSDTANMTSNANITEMQRNILQTGETGSDFLVILVIAFIGGIAISYLAFFGTSKK